MHVLDWGPSPTQGDENDNQLFDFILNGISAFTETQQVFGRAGT